MPHALTHIDARTARGLRTGPAARGQTRGSEIKMRKGETWKSERGERDKEPPRARARRRVSGRRRPGRKPYQARRDLGAGGGRRRACRRRRVRSGRSSIEASAGSRFTRSCLRGAASCARTPSPCRSCNKTAYRFKHSHTS